MSTTITMSSQDANFLRKAVIEAIEAARTGEGIFAKRATEYPAGSNSAEHWAGLAVDRRYEVKRLNGILSQIDEAR